MNKFILTVLIAFFLCIPLAACTFSANKDNVASGKSIKIGLIASPGSLNPFVAEFNGTSDIDSILMRGLIDWDDKWQLYPVLASRVPTLSNGDVIQSHPGNLSMRVAISPDARWSNGTYVSGNDFLFANQVAAHPAIAKYSNWWLSKMVRLQSRTEYELEFSANVSNYLFLLYFKPLPRYTIEDYFLRDPGKYFSGYALSKVSNGPYKIDNVHVLSSGKISDLTLIKNSEYINSHVQIPILNFYFYNKEGFESALFSGSIDYAPYITPEQANMLKSNENFNLLYTETPWVHIVYLNTDSLSDLKLRRAIFAAINRDAIVKDFYDDKGVVAESYLNRRHKAFLPVFSSIVEKTSKSRADKYDKKVVLNIAYKNEPVSAKIFDILQKQLIENGFVVKNVPYLDKYDPKNSPDLLIDVTNVGPWVTPLDVVSPSGSKALFSLTNRSLTPLRWNSVKNDDICVKYLSTFDEQVRLDLLKQQQALIADELPLIPLFFDINISAVKKNIKNVNPRGFGSDMWNVEDWVLEDN